MSTHPSVPARGRPALVACLVISLVGAVVVGVVALRPDRAVGAGPEVVVDEEFSSAGATARFVTSGPGSWRVGHGSYVLHSGRTGLRAAGRSPLSVLSVPVSSSSWRLATTVRTRRATGTEFSVVFAHLDRSNYSYLHLDRDRALSGIYRVRRGHTTRLARLTAAVTPGRAQRVELVGVAGKVKVYVGQVGDPASAYVGGVAVGGLPVLKPGFGSWGASVWVDDLLVTVPSGPGGVPTSTGTAITAPTSPPTSPPPTVPTATPPPGGRSVAVASSAELTAALADARPGDVITLADGVYTTKGLVASTSIGGKQYYGTFVLERSGTAQAPIVVQGSRAAVIDGKPGGTGTGTQYGLYLADADHVTVSGLTVRNVTKGIVLDLSSHVTLADLEVHTTGQEGIHLRTFSTDDVVEGNVVHDTGQKNETYGEGIYVGSANSNWGTYTDGDPDASDRNRLIGNTIYRTGAESMDLKEGTTDGVVRGNTFDGAGMSGSWADSWIDLKGNGWLVEDNHGTNALEDGFQVHQALAGWGNGNVFRGNVAAVNGPGYGFWLQNGVTGTQIACANTVSGAASGFATVACTPGF